MLISPSPDARECARILLIEDDQNDERFLRRALAKLGRRIALDVATDGNSALEYLLGASGSDAPKNVLLVLSDIHIPLRSGWEVLSWIRGHSRLARLPVFLWTSLPTPEGSERARRLGALLYLSKPRNLDGYSRIASLIVSALGD